MEQLEAEGGGVNSAERLESTTESKTATKRSVEDAQLVWDLLDKVN
jgi:hypothetical protein